VANSGNFVRTTPLIWRDASPFDSFMRWNEWLFARCGRTHAIALRSLAEMLHEYLTRQRGIDEAEVAKAMESDLSPRKTPRQAGATRQARHLKQTSGQS
jgi:hypothetical protein